MPLYCPCSVCSQPRNDRFTDDLEALRSVDQLYCTSCGTPLILKDRYVPQYFLGRGGFGTTLIGRDRHKPRMPQCVIKILQPPSHFSEAQLQTAKMLFDREAEALLDLGGKHPHIPNLYAFFQEKDTFYLVQEFIDGESLEQLLASKGVLAEPEVREILRSMLEIIDFVHQNNHFHRDIKPSNIMRKHGGELYLIDFGAVKRATGLTTNTPTGVFTRGYAAPEITRGGRATTTTDLYSLAVTCIVLLTGKAPEALFDPDLDRWCWLEMGSWQDKSLIAVLNQMLQSQSEARFPTALAVLTALEAHSPEPSDIIKRTLRSPLPLFITRAAFNGFEIGLLAIVSLSLAEAALLGSSLWIVLVAGLVGLQLSKKLSRNGLFSAISVTTVGVLLIPHLRDRVPFFAEALWPTIFGFSVAATLYVIAIALVFRLVYLLMA